MSKIALIITGTRPKRIALQVAEWLKPILDSESGSATVTQVDLADFNLPVFDEEAAPAMVPKLAQHTKEHSKRWSAEISKYDGYVLLANEYNFGMSGSTKNAIVYLYNEWIGKPILIVTYGIEGGINTSEQLSKVLTGMKLRVCGTRPALPFHGKEKGPDMYEAVNGVLGKASKSDWDASMKTEISKGMGELSVFLTSGQPNAT